MSSSPAPLYPFVRAWQQIPLGLRYMVGASLGFSLMALFVKLAAGDGLGSQQIVFGRSAVIWVLCYAQMRRQGVSTRGVDRPTLVARGLAGLFAMSLFYYAIARLPLGDVSALYYASPLSTTLFAALLLGERVGTSLTVSLLGGLLGVVLIAQPSFLFGTLHFDPLPVAAVVVGSVLSGLAYTFVRKLRQTDHPLTIIFWFSMVCTLGSLPGTLAGWVWPSVTGWTWLLLVGVATHLAQVCLTYGLRLEPAGRASAVGYLQIVFAFLWGLLFFGDTPNAWTLVGCALIFSSVLLLARRPG